MTLLPSLEDIGLPPGAGNFALKYLPELGRVLLACIVPSSSEPELLAWRIYSRRADEQKYTLLGSLEPWESWGSPLLFKDGILVVSENISKSETGNETTCDFVCIKYVEFSGAAPREVWRRPDRSTWVCELLGPGSRPDEVCCRIARISDAPDRRARYSVSMLNLTSGSLTDITDLALVFY
jgi:hypothetical protein